MSTTTKLKKIELEVSNLNSQKLGGKIAKIQKDLINANYCLIRLYCDSTLDRQEQGIAKKLNLDYKVRLGAYNGYGYEKLGQEFDQKDFENIEKTLKTFIKKTKKEFEKAPKKEKKVSNKPVVSPEVKWAKRLSKLADISFEAAVVIAEEKLEYKQNQIDIMDDRQFENYSERRQKLINKMMRENPLRRIEDEEHANRIVGASNRHKNSNYEEKLEELRNDAKWGLIDYADVRERARQEMQY
jgi:hypothetical protein